VYASDWVLKIPAALDRVDSILCRRGDTHAMSN
jgi:hypothetical protein